MIRLSFIVPFYNVEPYIEQCIRSLYAQDIPWEEYEVICIDDCSPDGSRTIVERLQKEFPTLRLICHSENKRQGGARNTGLRAAQGRYIWFVDSDDFIRLNCLSKLLNQAERNALDVLKFYFADENGTPHILEMKESHLCTGSELIFDVETNEPIASRCCSAVQQILKASFLKRHAIAFAENVQYEDDDFAYQVYAYASKTMLIPETPYCVRTTIGSTTRRKNDLRRINDIYSQLLRTINLDEVLSSIDSRWHDIIKANIRDSIVNQVFVMLNDCSLKDVMHFWRLSGREVRKIRQYLSRKSYLRFRFLPCYYLAKGH